MTNNSRPSVYNQWKLILEDEQGHEEAFLVTGDTVTVGRDQENDIPLDNPHVSKQHARFIKQDNQLIIEDLSSINGTIVNAGPLIGAYTLRPNDTIKIGPYTFRVEKTLANLPQSSIKTSVHTVATKSSPREAEPGPPEPMQPMQPMEPMAKGPLIGAAVGAAVLILLLAAFLLGWFGRSLNQPPINGPTPAADNRSVEGPVALDVPALTINELPTADSLPPGQPVSIKVTARDQAGMRRIELWAEGQKVDELMVEPAVQRESLTAALAWTPAQPGTYTLEVRAYNRSGLVSRESIGPLLVVGPETPTPTPTASPTPVETETPSPTLAPTRLAAITPLPDSATLLVEAPTLTVRSGPSGSYTEVAELTEGDAVEILSQAEIDGEQWWQIRYRQGNSRYLGWVLVDPATTSVVSATPTATSTPTSTPRRVTVTATALSVAANSPTPTATPMPTSTPTPEVEFILAPPGKTLLIISNRSLGNQPARLTLSGGKSVGGGQEFDVPSGQERQVVLEPDEYRAMWSSTARSGFARGWDFEAVAGKVMVMWIVPEEGRTETEIYDRLVTNPEPEPVATALPSATPDPVIDRIPPPGQAMIVVANRSMANANANLTVSGGSFGGGEEFVLDANTETVLEMAPGEYRGVWNIPIRGGMFLGNEFDISVGEVVLFWIVPEDGTLFMQRPGQEPDQINN